MKKKVTVTQRSGTDGKVREFTGYWREATPEEIERCRKHFESTQKKNKRRKAS